MSTDFDHFGNGSETSWTRRPSVSSVASPSPWPSQLQGRPWPNPESRPSLHGLKDIDRILGARFAHHVVVPRCGSTLVSLRLRCWKIHLGCSTLPLLKLAALAVANPEAVGNSHCHCRGCPNCAARPFPQQLRVCRLISGMGLLNPSYCNAGESCTSTRSALKSFSMFPLFTRKDAYYMHYSPSRYVSRFWKNSQYIEIGRSRMGSNTPGLKGLSGIPCGVFSQFKLKLLNLKKYVVYIYIY